ncbi:MAG TPA: DEAD/DEAH box helicase [Dermatophilaceae bacterium]|nr:DEAD/DEAH box helicase [Dermatophilaceae bacterium]
METGVARAAWVEGVSDALLSRHYDPGTLARGSGYAVNGAVRGVSVADGGDLVLAEVTGSGRAVYSTLVRREDDGGPGDVEWFGRCSCPVGAECKHVVAVLLVLRERLRAMHAGPDAAGAPPRSWQEVFAPLLPAGKDAAAVARDGHESLLGVSVTVSDVPGSPWGRPGHRRVVLSPRRLSRTGRWLRSVTWDGLASDGTVTSREHRELAADLARLARARVAVAYGGVRAAVTLDDLGTDGWRWLRRALEAGVPLVPGEAGERVVTVDVEEVEPHASVRADDDGLVVSVGLRAVPEGTRVELVGRPPHTALLDTSDGVVVRPVAVHAPAALPLVGAGEVVVPRAEVADFVRDYLPGLRRRMRVESPDGSVAADLAARPRLVLTVAPAGTGAVDVTWGIRYAVPGLAADPGPLRPVEVPFASREHRDREAEALLLAGVDALPDVPRARLVPLPHPRWLPATRDRYAAGEMVRFVGEVLPRLRGHPDVDVEEAGGIPVLEEAATDPTVTLDVDDAAEDDLDGGGAGGAGGTDWFDLTVSVTVDEEEVPLAALLAALRAGDDVLVLPSGTWFRLDRPELDRLRTLLEESQHVDDGPRDGLRLGRFELGYWAELEALGVVRRQCAAWEEHTRVLRAGTVDYAPPLPSGLRAELRPYQVEGYHWLRALWTAGLGGVLADDMGLGKTVQTLAAVLAAKEAGELTEPVLVVAPTSVLATWRSEAGRFTPDLVVTELGRTSRTRGRSLPEAVAGADLVVTSYAVVRIDAEEFAARPWRAVLLDEAHTVKNHQSKTYAAVRRLRRPFTLALTGTPVENGLMDLWSLLSLVAPGLFPRPDRFAQVWRRPIEGGDAARSALLRARIRPLVLRRTKEEVATDLPPKQVQVVPVPLLPAHRRIYDRHLLRERQRVLGLLDDPDANRVEILASLTRMRQLALDAALPKGPDGSPLAGSGALPPSAKVEYLVDQVAELATEGHRALVFSQFTGLLARVRSRLDAAEIASCYLDGRTRKRQEVIRAFREGDAPVFLISLKAGGVGLTLTEADYVFVLDPWWNPAAESQAIDRAHRIGQDRPVMVYRLVSEDTIEEKVLALQQRKRDLAARLVDDDAFTGGLTPQDIGALLAPAAAG